MKSLSFYQVTTILLFCLLCLSTGQAQSNPDPKLLVGSWQFMDGPSFARISPEYKETLDADIELKTKVFAGYTNRILNFFPDGSFSQVEASGREVRGKWEVNGQLLTITSESGYQWVQQITSLKNNQVVLQQRIIGDGEPIIPELYFFKNN